MSATVAGQMVGPLVWRARRWLVASAAVVALGLAAAPASARDPVIAYLNTSNQLQLYDSQTGAAVPAPSVTVSGAHGFAVSFDGRYIAYIAKSDGNIHLFDRVANAEIPLPGINIYTGGQSPDDLSVSDTGLIAFDDGGTGGTVVYKSAIGTFVPTGLSTSGNSGPRDPALSGDGNFLATTCITASPPATSTCPSPNFNPGHATLFLQTLMTQTDTGLPVIDPNAGAGGTDEEHPCTDANGGFVGADALDSGAINNVYIFNRSTGADLSIPGLNTPGKSTVYCVLSFGGAYVGVANESGVVRLYDVATGSQIPVPATITAPTIWFTAPFVPPSAPTITTPANGAQFTKGEVVDAGYSCSDPVGGMGIASCTGPVAPGGPVDTSTAGTHSFTVTATDVNGLTAVTTSNYTVVAPLPLGPVILTAAQVRAALLRVLKPHGKAARIGHLLRDGGYSFSFTAPSAGRLVIGWYRVPKGAHIARAKKPVLVASGSAVFHKAEKGTIKVSLTHKGRKLLKHATRVKLTAKATFTPAGGPGTSATKIITLTR